jgi:hypothetical protein
MEIPGYDGEKSNYGNIHQSPDKFRKETGDTSKENEDVFYFFTLHDYNKDHHLDGHELALAFMGYEFYKEEEVKEDIRREDLEFMVDHALLEDDKDNDGKISWVEYLESQNYHHQL